jgi:hypothetical protein
MSDCACAPGADNESRPLTEARLQAALTPAARSEWPSLLRKCPEATLQQIVGALTAACRQHGASSQAHGLPAETLPPPSGSSWSLLSSLPSSSSSSSSSSSPSTTAPAPPASHWWYDPRDGEADGVTAPVFQSQVRHHRSPPPPPPSSSLVLGCCCCSWSGGGGGGGGVRCCGFCCGHLYTVAVARLL